MDSTRIDELKRVFSGLEKQLVIISGPSAGAGKGKVIKELLDITQIPMWLSVSSTTRQPRPGEKLHHLYTFLTQEEFESAEAKGAFLEANGVTDSNRYGTPLKPILDHLAQGDIVLLEIEVHGGRFVHDVVPDALFIFIKPTDGDLQADLAELRRRITGRGTESAASIDRRICQAEDELRLAEEWGFYDRWVVNASGHSMDAAKEVYSLILDHSR